MGLLELQKHKCGWDNSGGQIVASFLHIASIIMCDLRYKWGCWMCRTSGQSSFILVVKLLFVLPTEKHVLGNHLFQSLSYFIPK